MMVPFFERDVPCHMALEVRIKRYIVLFFGVKNHQFHLAFLRQKPEQRCVVLNGVSGQNGETFQERERLEGEMDSMVRIRVFALSRDVYSVNGVRSGCQDLGWL